MPVLTMEGGQFVSHMGASFITSTGLPDWVGLTDAEYAAKAAAVAQDHVALLELKRGLRARPLARHGWYADRYAKDVGAAVQEMWHETFRQR